MEQVCSDDNHCYKKSLLFFVNKNQLKLLKNIFGNKIKVISLLFQDQSYNDNDHWSEIQK